MTAPHEKFRSMVDAARSALWHPPATYQDVADDIGCSLATLNCWMRGTHGISERWHHAVAEALGVSVQAIQNLGVTGVSGRRSRRRGQKAVRP